MYRIPNMSALQHIGQTLRTLRESKAMSQQALAGAAGISRTTLIQIEKGKDAQASSIEAAARVLGVDFGLLHEPPDMALRREARAQLMAKQAASREKHLKIALQLALGGEKAQALQQGALQMVQMWKARQLCSPTYIERWQQILEASPAQVAQNMLDMDDEWGAALRQNTPFAMVSP